MSLQVIANELVRALATKDKTGLEGLISPDITFTLTTNSKDTITKQGEDEYLTLIRGVWEKTIECRYSSSLYKEYTPNSGEITFEQIYLTKDDGKNVIVLKKGKQTFSLENKKIINICEEDSETYLTEEEYRDAIAKIDRQKHKMRTPPTPNLLRECGCRIL